MANSIDPNEMAHNEPSHLDLQFAICKAYFLVYRVKRVNQSALIRGVEHYFFYFSKKMYVVRCFY